MAKCGEECEIYSRVTGYYRPVANYNKGKAEEFRDRVVFNMNSAANQLHGTTEKVEEK